MHIHSSLSRFAALAAFLWAVPAMAMIPVAGDVNDDGVVNALDVQLVINAALGLIDDPKTDISRSGSVDAQDVQLVINAALGIEIDRVGNGLADAAEINLGTDPDLFDTSGDGIPDGVAVALGLDPLVAHDIDAELVVVPSVTTIGVGEALAMEARSSFPYFDVSWSMDNSGAASLDADGELTGTGEGEVFITATDAVSGASATARIGVVDDPTPEVAGRAVRESFMRDEGGRYPTPIDVLEDGEQFALENLDYFEYLEDRAPDLSTPANKATAWAKDQGRPEADRVTLDAWQTPIRHQRDRGTCSSFAVAAAVEAAYTREMDLDFPLELSPQFIHHLGKQNYLYDWADNEETPTQDGHENSIAMRSGAGIIGTLGRVKLYGVPMGHYAPYRHTHYASADFQRGDYANTDQDGDEPRIGSDRDGTVTQALVNSFNMEQEPTEFRFPGSKTFAPLPQAAIEAAYFSITGYTQATGGEVRDPAWYEWQLAEGRELVFSANFLRTVGDDGIVYPRDAAHEDERSGHAMLIVGYDRTDPGNPYLIVKNSWGESGYLKLSYDWIHGEKDGRINGVAYITGIVEPEAGVHHPRLFFGSWRLVRDGQGGILDIHRQSGYYNPDRLGGLDDNRLGAFFRLGDTHRVNGWLNNDGTAEFYIDPAFGNLPFDALEGDRFEAHLYPGEPTLLAGSFFDTSGVRRPFYANKGEHLTGIARFESIAFETFLGRWEVVSPGADGWVEVRSGSAAQGSFSGRHISPETPGGGFFANMQGTLDPATQEISFAFPSAFLEDPPVFDGQIHADSPGIISGLATANGEVYPMVLVRTGSATQQVTILSPESGEVFSEAATIPLECEVREDGVLVPNPPVTWTLGESQADGGMVIGTGASTSTKRGAGLHEIFANYQGTVTDRVTITVESAEAPGVSIHSPDDGEHIFDLSTIPFVSVECAGSAVSQSEGPLSGDALRWYYRHEDDTQWTDSGERGTEAVLNLQDTDSQAATLYEIMLEAEDSLGNIGTAVISITITGLPIG